MPADKVTPERIMQIMWGFAPPLILEAALRNGVFDALHAAPLTVAEASRKTGASERGLAALMDALVGLELLEKDDRGRYALTPEAAAFLVSTAPGYRGAMLRHFAGQLMPGWLNLAEIARTGRPAMAVNQETAGSEFFQGFVESLFASNYATAQALGAHLGVPGTTTALRVLDLAAGSGVWSIALAEQSPEMRVTAVDWPGVLITTRRVVERHGLTPRYRFVAGDLRDADFGTGHDLALLGHILHSEGAERSQALLRKTFGALAPGGRIAIAEFLVNADRRGPLLGLLFAVNMLVGTEHGGTFSFEEIRAWLEAAGFREVQAVDVPGPSPLIVAQKPGP